MSELIKIKHIKGKQNKKKWNKNIDVSQLMDNIEKHNLESQMHNHKQLIVQNTAVKIRSDLDPNRFKRSSFMPKQTIIHKVPSQNFINTDLKDIWQSPATTCLKLPPQQIPSIVKPMSGISYNTTKEEVAKIESYIMQTEGKPQIKIRKTKKIVKREIVPRSRNKNVRAEYLKLRQGRHQKKLKHQFNSMKLIAHQLAMSSAKAEQKQRKKIQKKKKMEEEAQCGKITEGPKIGKLKYSYRQYLPQRDTLKKPLSKVSSNQDLMRDRYDSIFRRGIMEVRNIKVHKNQKKNVKVREGFRV